MHRPPRPTLTTFTTHCAQGRRLGVQMTFPKGLGHRDSHFGGPMPELRSCLEDPPKTAAWACEWRSQSFGTQRLTFWKPHACTAMLGAPRKTRPRTPLGCVSEVLINFGALGLTFWRPHAGTAHVWRASNRLHLNLEFQHVAHTLVSRKTTQASPVGDSWILSTSTDHLVMILQPTVHLR